MENEVVAQILGDLRVGIEGCVRKKRLLAAAIFSIIEVCQASAARESVCRRRGRRALA